jgi:hypothetical protein
MPSLLITISSFVIFMSSARRAPLIVSRGYPEHAAHAKPIPPHFHPPHSALGTRPVIPVA